MPKAVLNILLRRQMRKQGQSLEEIADVAFLRRAIDLAFRGKQIMNIYRNFAVGWSDEAGYAIEEGGFTGARGAEKNGDTGWNGEIDVELERRKRSVRTLELCADGKI